MTRKLDKRLKSKLENYRIGRHASLVRMTQSESEDLFLHLIKIGEAYYSEQHGGIAGVPRRVDKQGYMVLVHRVGFAHEHRVVARLHGMDTGPGEVIDHIDGNKENNRVENLRVLDNMQNWHRGLSPNDFRRFAKKARDAHRVTQHSLFETADAKYQRERKSRKK